DHAVDELVRADERLGGRIDRGVDLLALLDGQVVASALGHRAADAVAHDAAEHEREAGGDEDGARALLLALLRDFEGGGLVDDDAHLTRATLGRRGGREGIALVVLEEGRRRDHAARRRRSDPGRRRDGPRRRGRGDGAAESRLEVLDLARLFL